MRIRHLFISPGHNFFGLHHQPSGKHPVLEPDAIECVAGQGIRGDRFFGYRENYKGKGGLRARILTGGMLRREASSAECEQP